MKNYKQLLTSFVEVITFLTAAFGGFLKAIAPPIGSKSYAVGAISFLVLIVLMIVSAISRRHPASKPSQARWLTAGIISFVIAISAVFIYPRLLDKFTYPLEARLSERRVIASDKSLTEDARRYKDANYQSKAKDLIQNLPDDRIWTDEGIEQARSELLAGYTCLVVSLSTAIFCLLEANLQSK